MPNPDVETLQDKRCGLVSDSSLAILVGVCSEGGKIEADSARDRLAELTGIRPSSITGILNKTLKKRGLMEADLKSKPQIAEVTEYGKEVLAHNLERVDSLKVEQEITRFPVSTFRLLDYLVQEVGSENWLKSELSEDPLAETLVHELGYKSIKPLSRLINSLKGDGYIELLYSTTVNKKKGFVIDIKLTEAGLEFYNLLKEHPKAIELIGDPHKDDPYNLEFLSNEKLVEVFGDVCDEVKMMHGDLGVIYTEANLSEMSRERRIEEITNLYDKMNGSMSMVEDSGDEVNEAERVFV